MRALGFALLLLLAAGCGTTQIYDGPKKPLHEVAVLRTNAGEIAFVTTWIGQIDGKELVAAYSEFEVLPGRHSLRVLLKAGILGASRNFSIDAKAGHTYRVKGIFSRSSAYAWIEDESTGEIVAGEKP